MKKNFFCWIVCIFLSFVMTAAFAADAYYDRLIDQEKFKRLDRSTVSRMQRNLAQIYQDDREWIRDAALSRHPLTDGVMGPVTLYWLQRFIHDFRIEPIGPYVNETKNRLERIASFTNMFPEEAKVLISADFAKWNDDQPELEKNGNYAVRRKGTDQALLDLVYRYLPPGSPAGKNQPVIHYYELTAEDFEVLQGKSQLYAQLSKLVNKKFDNVAALKEVVAGALKDHPKLVEKLMPVIEQYYRYANPVISQSFLEILAGDPFFSSLNSVLVTLLEKTLKGVAYPSKNLFDQAAKSKILAGIGACQDRNKQNAYLSSFKIGDDDFKKLSEDLLTGPYQGIPDFFQQLEVVERLYQYPKGNCNDLELASIGKFVSDLYEQVVQPAIAPLYKKNPVYPTASTVQWDGAGCGCVMDNLSGTVYGFYPFWLAGKAQSVNFSVLSRVAYYGLSFDDDGIVKHANAGDDESAILSASNAKSNAQLAFIQTARKHNSKVDWVIRNDEFYWDRWKKLSSVSRAVVLENLTENITGLLTARMTDGFSKIKQGMTFGMITPPALGDGVTLYFDDFPDDQESVKLFNQFFFNLQKRLQLRGDYFVNIVVPQSKLGKGIYHYPNLLTWVKDLQSDTEIDAPRTDLSREGLKTKILVLIEEPTTDSKKKLRLDIENGELHGTERGMLLRNIIPVIEFDGKNWKQLEDDVVYFKDNFGGIGFWPLHTDKAKVVDEMQFRCHEIQSVSGCLIRYFQNATWRGEPESMLEKFVCENRTYFRLGVGLLITLSLVYTILYFYSCRIHHRIKNLYVFYLIFIVMPTLIAAVLLLSFDPELEPTTAGNMALILIILSGVVISIIVYQFQKKHTIKPSRSQTD
ncbi:hypothetical protein HS096_06485 [candidate division WWE3 bacterium]|uniref:Uncharacterized protein n=1 Tax=candidate division WWE3 bacterium TaxID=2053526 RepID=A0A928TU89_UNCKA|nr:hypothetical protein [candidate division WWE3 bacterium]